MTPDFDVLLLDFGGPCLVSPFELHDVAEQRFGLEPGTLSWKGPIDPDSDELYRTMVGGGVLSEREYWYRRTAEVAELIGRPDLELHDWFHEIYDPPRPGLIRPECLAVTDAARAAGIGVSVLTNDLSAFHGEEWAKGVPFVQTLDHLVDLSHTGFLKPDPRGFELAIETVGAPADRILFLDDQPGNCDGARAVGIETVFLDIADPASSWREVAKRLELDVTI